MDCQNEFCIYQDKGKCTLDNTSIDIRGCCEECIYPNMSEGVLNFEKKRTLRMLTELE